MVQRQIETTCTFARIATFLIMVIANTHAAIIQEQLNNVSIANTNATVLQNNSNLYLPPGLGHAFTFDGTVIPEPLPMC